MALQPQAEKTFVGMLLELPPEQLQTLYELGVVTTFERDEVMAHWAGICTLDGFEPMAEPIQLAVQHPADQLTLFTPARGVTVLTRDAE